MPVCLMVMNTWGTLHAWSSPPLLTAATGKETSHQQFTGFIFFITRRCLQIKHCLMTLQTPGWKYLHAGYPYIINQTLVILSLRSPIWILNSFSCQFQRQYLVFLAEHLGVHLNGSNMFLCTQCSSASLYGSLQFAVFFKDYC